MTYTNNVSSGFLKQLRASFFLKYGVKNLFDGDIKYLASLIVPFLNIITELIL